MLNAVVAVDREKSASLRSVGKRVPLPQQITVLVDTGSSRSMIDRQVLQELNVISFDKESIYTASHEDCIDCALFKVSLAIRMDGSDLVFNELTVGSCNLRKAGYFGFIGRDILNLCSMVYDGPELHATLTHELELRRPSSSKA